MSCIDTKCAPASDIAGRAVTCRAAPSLLPASGCLCAAPYQLLAGSGGRSGAGRARTATDPYHVGTGLARLAVQARPGWWSSGTAADCCTSQGWAGLHCTARHTPCRPDRRGKVNWLENNVKCTILHPTCGVRGYGDTLSAPTHPPPPAATSQTPATSNRQPHILFY